MKPNLVILVLLLLLPLHPKAQTSAAFTAPDTICVGQTITLNNTSTGASSWYWSFCSGNPVYDPVGVNIGNLGLLSVPTYITLVKQGDSCFSFVTDQGCRCVVRNYHGKSFNKNPISSVNLGGFGMLGDTVEGIRIRKDNGRWIGIVNNNNRLARLDFGNSLSNTPTATRLGPYSMLYTAHCLEILQENSSWIGILACSWGNKMVRLEFGNSLLNSPNLVNLGTMGVLNMPATFSIIQENGNWYSINSSLNSRLARLSFGNSLMNAPVGTDLGQVCGPISTAGITLIRDCNSTTGFVLNYTPAFSSQDQMYRLAFPSGATGTVSGTSMGNIGSMNQPHGFSEIFRVGDTLFAYVTNRSDGTLTRLRFLPCVNASIPSSTQFNPPAYSYDQPGIYNVQLIADEGLPTQSAVCKHIVVVNSGVLNLGPDKSICQGDTATLDAGPGFTSYLWSTGETTQSIKTLTPGSYWVNASTSGCSDSDTVSVSVSSNITVSLPTDTSICDGQTIELNASYPGASYQWQDGSTDPVYSVTQAGLYWVKVSKNGCSGQDSILVSSCPGALFFPTAFSPDGNGKNDLFRCIGARPAKYDLSIFSVWGGQVFHTTNPDEGWDGSFHGTSCSAGVFTYVASYEIMDVPGKSYKVKGTFTLLR